jgi:hypothetical protein
MGSRYGGLKQLDGLGPNGETSGFPLSMMPFRLDWKIDRIRVRKILRLIPGACAV